jgi:hypothetical protein
MRSGKADQVEEYPEYPVILMQMSSTVARSLRVFTCVNLLQNHYMLG